MTKGTFGALAAGAVASLLGSAAFAGSETGNSATKACFRQHCGKSIKGYKGQCGGTKVESFSDEKACAAVGEAWTTEGDAEKFKKKS